MTIKKVLFVGAGRMAQAMISGMTKRQESFTWKITATNRSNTKKLQELSETYGIQSTSNWLEEVSEQDVIILAMPPENHPDILRTLSAYITPRQLIVSVAAGIGIKGLATPLPKGSAVAWVMPNTAASLGESMSLFTCSDDVSDTQRTMLIAILNNFGRYFECDEDQLHHLTAITGSAPAFIFEVAAALQNMAMEYGISKPNAQALVGQMILGSARLLQTGANAAQLADEVTTPGGATAAGRKVLDEASMKDAFERAIIATNNRAKELGQPDKESKKF